MSFYCNIHHFTRKAIPLQSSPLDKKFYFIAIFATLYNLMESGLRWPVLGCAVLTEFAQLLPGQSNLPKGQENLSKW